MDRGWRWSSRRAFVLPCAVALAGWVSAGPVLECAATSRQPLQEIGFTRGPALTPAAAALSYLDRLAAETRARRVRLSVSLTLDEHRLAIVDARLGQPGDTAAPRLRLDDGALGVSLLDRARDLCPAGLRCVLGLVGYWRGSADGVGRLEVRRVDGLVPEAAEWFIEIEIEGSEQGREL